MDFREEEVFSRSHKVRRSFLSLVAALVVAMSASSALAAIQFNLDEEFNFAPSAPVPLVKPSGTDGSIPWVKVRVFDSADTDGDYPGIEAYNLASYEALIIVETTELLGSEFLNTLGMNYDGPGTLSLSYLGGGASSVTINTTNPFGGFSVDTTGLYDFAIDFGSDFFGGEIAFFRASVGSPNTVVAEDFDAPSSGNPFYHIAAQINGISGNKQGYITDTDPPTDPEGSPVPPVPEPATLAIWGLGLGIAGLVRLRRRSQAA
jgi:hypothetical protein